jgi:hypothetical protein
MNRAIFKILLLVIAISITACSSLTTLFYTDMETGLDELHKDHKENAKIIFQRECDHGERSGCAQLGFILENEEKNEAANFLYQKACDLGEYNYYN